MEPEAATGRRNEQQPRLSRGVYYRRDGRVAFVRAGLVLSLARRAAQAAAAAALPFGAEEQTYAAANSFSGSVDLSQASNLLNQQFTYATGIVSNDGSRARCARVELTLEFHDQFNQAILRETRSAPVDLRALRSRPGEAARFPDHASNKHIPSTWDQQYPSIRVSGLVLQ